MPLQFFRARRIAAAGLLCFASVATAAYAGDATVRIDLDAMNGSGESGFATLTPQGAKTLVELHLKGGSGDPQPAHFHSGTCEKYGPRPLYLLRSVVKGDSVTTLDLPMEKLVAGDLVINVHKSFDDIATIASCAIAKTK